MNLCIICYKCNESEEIIAYKSLYLGTLQNNHSVKKQLSIKLLITLLCVISCTSFAFAQKFVKKITLKQKIEKSSLVIEGRVVAKQSFWDDHNKLIYTANTVEVYSVFKGEVAKTVEVITVGGTVGLTALMTSNAVKLNKGDVGVFTLKNSTVNSNEKGVLTHSKFDLYSGQQGFYKYDLNKDLVVTSFGKKKGIKSDFYEEIRQYAQAKVIKVKAISSRNEVSKGNIAKSALVLGIESFSPTTAMGGVKMELTITGTDFGDEKGKVGFANANDGGATFVDALDTQVVSWTNTQVVVEVPSGAGTGKIRITNADGSGVVESANILTISYSEVNVNYAPETTPETPEVAYQVRHADIDGDGGYTWEMFTDFFNDSDFPGAKAAYERAFNNWVCETGVNWSISDSPTTVDEVAFESKDGGDPVNVIRFDNGSLSDETLGTCFYWFKGCSIANTISWYVAELDIVFNSEDILWNLGPDPTSGGAFDFESVALHELGHGHMLAHVIDPNNSMHYANTPNADKRVIESNNSNAAKGVQDRSTGSSVCGVPAMSDASCPLSVPEEEFANNISIYPNPTNGVFYIKNRSLINIDRIAIFDITGKLVLDQDFSTSSDITINLEGYAKGMYFIDLLSDENVITSKLLLD